MLAQDGHEVNGHGWANDVYAKDATPEQERAEIAALHENADGSDRRRDSRSGWTSSGIERIGLNDRTSCRAGLHLGRRRCERRSAVRPTNKKRSVCHPAPDQHMQPTTSPRGYFLPIRQACSSKTSPRHSISFIARAKKAARNGSSMTLHAHMAGRPTMASTIRRCLDYVKKHDDVSFSAQSRHRGVDA